MKNKKEKRRMKRRRAGKGRIRGENKSEVKWKRLKERQDGRCTRRREDRKE